VTSVLRKSSRYKFTDRRLVGAGSLLRAGGTAHGGSDQDPAGGGHHGRPALLHITLLSLLPLSLLTLLQEVNIMADPPYSTSLFSTFYHSHCLHTASRGEYYGRPTLLNITLLNLLPFSLLTLFQEVNIMVDPPYSTSLFSAFYHSHCLQCRKRHSLLLKDPSYSTSLSSYFTTLLTLF
jgi:hypothetical protein